MARSAVTVISFLSNIFRGRTNRRNPTLTEHASQILPCRGMGSGIPRALNEWSRIDLNNDVQGNQFSAVIWRPEPEWPSTVTATPEVTPEVGRLLVIVQGEQSRVELMAALSLKDDEHFRKAYLSVALEAGLIERTIPDKPNSRNQKYRLTAAGRVIAGAKTKQSSNS
ncbi:MAG: hypothetical protein Q8S94_11310 [Pseudohongiella sp.]|nr:hypothetical protein [Pseudohongiella sp.]